MTIFIHFCVHVFSSWAPEEASIDFLLSFTPVLENNVKFRLLLLPELYPESPRCLQRSVCVHVCVHNRSEWTCSGLCMSVFATVRVHLCVFSLVFFRRGLVFLKDRTNSDLMFLFPRKVCCWSWSFERWQTESSMRAWGHDERRHLLPPNANHENTYSPWNSRDDQENQDNLLFYRQTFYW